MISKPISDTWLWQYRQAIADGEIIAGEDMTTELDNLLEDIASPDYIYDTADADLRIEFIEGCLRFTKSPYYGKPFKLLLWEKAFIEAVYSFKIRSIDSSEIVDRFVEILLLITRKSGKTELIAALEFAELVLGNPGSDIVCSGTDDGTADLAYQTVDTMRVLVDPKSLDTWRNQKGIKCLVNGSHIYKLSASTRQREGRNIDVAGIDEVWSLEKGDDIYKVIQQSTSTKEQSKIFLFGSEGFVEDGFLDNKREEYRKIIYKEDDTLAAKRKLPWIYSMDSEREVWDTNDDGISPIWEKANPSIGTAKKWSYLRDRVEEARSSKSDRAFTLAKDFNIKVSNSLAWLDPQNLANTGYFTLEEFTNSIAIGGVDLAETTDMCAAKILMMRPNDRKKYIHSMYWIPEAKLDLADDKEAGADYKQWARDGHIRITEGNDIDVTAVADWFAELYKDYGIRTYKTGYDQRFAKEFLKRMDDYGFETEMINQNRYVLSNPMRLVEADIRDGRICYNENPIDTWCLCNTAVQVWDTGHIMPVKVKGQSARRIDGAVALIDAVETYRRYKSDFISAVGM